MNKKLELLPLRIIKTVIAFFISISIAPILNIDMFFSGLGSLKTMSQSITLSIQVVLEQMFSNFIAFVYAVLYASIFGINPFSISFALLTLFVTIKKISFFETYITSAVALIAIMIFSSTQHDLFSSAFVRIIATFFGMFVALFLNIILFRPKPIKDNSETLQKINEYIHIYLNNNFEEYIHLSIVKQLDKLDKEKAIIEDELRFVFNSKEKIQCLNKQLLEIEIAKSHSDLVFSIKSLDETNQNIFIPIIKRLNFIKQYPNDKEELIIIKNDIKHIYNQYTNDNNFFSNTRFLSKLSNYIELLLQY